jgi:hypothetical protein
MVYVLASNQLFEKAKITKAAQCGRPCGKPGGGTKFFATSTSLRGHGVPGDVPGTDLTSADESISSGFLQLSKDHFEWPAPHANTRRRLDETHMFCDSMAERMSASPRTWRPIFSQGCTEEPVDC